MANDKKKPKPKPKPKPVITSWNLSHPPPPPKAKQKVAPKAKPKAKTGLTKQESQIFDQMRGDIKKEGKASPSKLKGLTQQVTEDQYKIDELTGMGHPDAKALVKAGVPADRVQALTKQYAPAHPAANAGIGETKDPTTPQQSAADILIDAGLPDTGSNEKLLEAQMTEEGMPGSENNPLATTLQQQGSTSVNSAGVQQFPTAQEGDVADALTLKGSMPSLYNALATGNATPQDYAAALSASNYEGLGGASNPANVAYGQTFLQDAGQPETNFPAGGASPSVGGGSTLGTQALAQAAGQNAFSGLTNLFGSSTSPQTSQSLQSALAGLTSNPEQTTLTANTSQAPGSPDQAASDTQKTNVNPAALYQAQLAALLPGIRPGGSNG